MRLVISNSAKQLRQFLKSLSHTFDSYQGTKKQKKVFMRISNHSLALVNEFLVNGLSQRKLCLCNLNSNLFKIQNFESDEMGVIYKIDADNFLKIINSHIEPEITQLEILLPDQKGETDMEITYDTSEGIKNNFILSTQIQDLEWPFEAGGRLIPEKLQSNLINFIEIPPKFIKSIEHLKAYQDVWFFLANDHINIKKAQGNVIIDEQKLQKSSNYDFHRLITQLKGKTALLIKTEPFFRHLQISTRENNKTCIKLCVSITENVIDSGFLIIETFGQKRNIIEGFQIAITEEIIQNSVINEEKVSNKNLFPIEKITKKEQIEAEVSINRFYGKKHEQDYTNKLAARRQPIEIVDSKAQQIKMQKKFKIQL